MDPIATALQITFMGILSGTTVVLVLTYVSFLKMSSQILRTRMFIMADKIKHILLSFMLAYLSLTVVFMGGLGGIPIPQAISTTVVFFFFGAVAYSFLEMYRVARPTGRWNFRGGDKGEGFGTVREVPK